MSIRPSDGNWDWAGALAIGVLIVGLMFALPSRAAPDDYTPSAPARAVVDEKAPVEAGTTDDGMAGTLVPTMPALPAEMDAGVMHMPQYGEYAYLIVARCDGVEYTWGVNWPENIQGSAEASQLEIMAVLRVVYGVIGKSQFLTIINSLNPEWLDAASDWVETCGGKGTLPDKEETGI